MMITKKQSKNFKVEGKGLILRKKQDGMLDT